MVVLFVDMYMWLGEAEQRVRFHGPLPEEVEKLEELLQQHSDFASAMAQEQVLTYIAIPSLE